MRTKKQEGGTALPPHTVQAPVYPALFYTLKIRLNAPQSVKTLKAKALETQRKRADESGRRLPGQPEPLIGVHSESRLWLP